MIADGRHVSVLVARIEEDMDRLLQSRAWTESIAHMVHSRSTCIIVLYTKTVRTLQFPLCDSRAETERRRSMAASVRVQHGNEGHEYVKRQ